MNSKAQRWFRSPSGDAVLKTLAKLLRALSRPADFIARFGGDEFALILPATDFSGAASLAERLPQRRGGCTLCSPEGYDKYWGRHRYPQQGGHGYLDNRSGQGALRSKARGW